MKNAYAISSLAHQFSKVSEKIDSLAVGVQDTEQNAPDVSEVYQGLLMDEIEHLQILTLEITKLVTESTDDAANADEGDGGSAFAAGDLTTEKAGENGADEGEGGSKGQAEEQK